MIHTKQCLSLNSMVNVTNINCISPAWGKCEDPCTVSSVKSCYTMISALGTEDSQGLGANYKGSLGCSQIRSKLRRWLYANSPNLFLFTHGKSYGRWVPLSHPESLRVPHFLFWRALPHFLLLIHKFSFTQRARALSLKAKPLYW